MLRFSQNVTTFINIILFIRKIVTKSPSISPVQLSYRPFGFRLFISWKTINLNQKNEMDEFDKSFIRPESEKAKEGSGGASPWISGNMEKGRGQKKKLWKSGQADRLGWPPPPLPRSGQENVKNFDFDFWLWFMIIYDL